MTATSTPGTAKALAAQPAAAERRRPRLPFSPWHLLLAPLALVFAVPLVWLVLSSVMSNAEINRFPPALWPSGIDLGGYRYVLGNAMFPRWFVNSLIVSAVTVAANLVFGSLAGYAFARMRFAGSRVLMGLMLATMAVPFQLTMIPTFLVMKKPVDTVGAGDSFDAGFVAALLAGLALPEALELAAVCGALSTRAHGGTTAQPTWTTIAQVTRNGKNPA
ncbi:carbohydrate ABC transporter permease [Streptomyces violaceorubidus]